MLTSMVLAQDRSVSGTVSDGKGSVMPGVNVVIKGTSSGTTTDGSGKYVISVGSDATLMFSFIGFVTQQVVVGNRTSLDITLEEDATQLSEVVVTALGVQRDTRALQYSVTNVAGDNLTQARENNLGSSLQGRIAGVNVTKVGSGPAGSSRVIIRGNKSLQGNNQPLYVVDGIPMDNSGFGQAGVWGGRDEGDGLSSINPDDIESITVLKGANAAALYGSRAGNGVINITTKKGSARKGLGIEINSNYVFENVINQTDLQQEFGIGLLKGTTPNRVGSKPLTATEAFNNADQAWGAKLDGTSVVQFDGVSRPYSYAGDNWKRFYETGKTLTNSIALTGGSESQSFRFGYSDMMASSVIPNSNFDRRNLSMATNGKYGKLTLSAKVLYSNEKVKNRTALSDSPSNPVQSIYRLSPDTDVETLKGDPNKLGAVPVGVVPVDGKSAGEELQLSPNLWGQNPYWVAYQEQNNDVRDRIITSGQLRYDITPWLFAQGRFGMDWYTRKDHSLTAQGTGYNRGGAITEGEDRVRETNAEWTVGMNKAFGKFNVNGFVGGNAMHRSSERISANGSNFNVPFFASVINTSNQSFGYGFSESGINSLFGSAEVAYNNYLFVTATARNDWFSVLSPKNNSILYPSVGTSFVFTDAFTNLPSVLSFGKVRASWAQVGLTGSLNPYDVNLTYGLLGQGHLGIPMASFSGGQTNNATIPNANLLPATSTELEVGMDLRFYGGRLGFDVTYYSQKTTDDILRATISRGSGFGSTYVNVGELTNKGFEILITGTPVKGAITWDLSLNLAKNVNKVVALNPGIKELIADEPRTRTVFIKQIVGQPFGMITGWVQKRSPSGEPIFDANNGAPVRSTAYQPIGNGVAKLTGGLNNSITYKNINLSFLVDFKWGGDIYSGSNVRLTQWGLHKQTLAGRPGYDPITVTGVTESGSVGSEVYTPFTKTLTEEEARNYWSQMGNRVQDYFVYDASFIKIRQLTLGYTLPTAMLSKTPLKNVTVSFVGRNLALLFKNIDNVDPESAYQNGNSQGLDYFGMPTTRTFGFNVKGVF